MRWMMPIVAAVFLSGCSFNFPVVGRLNTGEPVHGKIVLNTNGVGTFRIFRQNGMSCAGTYDAYDESQKIRVPVTCSDGKTGIVIATRDASGLSGHAFAEIDDGLRGRFIWGNIEPSEMAAFLARTENDAE